MADIVIRRGKAFSQSRIRELRELVMDGEGFTSCNPDDYCSYGERKDKTDETKQHL